jgi:hypothetical protein
MIPISYKFIQIILMYLFVVSIKTGGICLAKGHNYDKIQKEATDENLKHCNNNQNIC